MVTTLKRSLMVVTPLPQQVQTIRDFSKPTTLRKLRKFLGLVNFYHRFIPRCVTIMTPLNSMLKLTAPNPVNMLKEFQVHKATESSYFADEVECESDEVLFWQEGTPQDQPIIGQQLTDEQLLQLQQILKEFSQVLRNQPGRTELAEHKIETGSAHPYGYLLTGYLRPIVTQSEWNYKKC